MKNKIKSYDSFNKFCTSLQVAKKFGRKHCNILRDIHNLHCSEQFRANHFRSSSYLDKGKHKKPMVLMTFEGFMLLINTFGGAKNIAIRVSIIMSIIKNIKSSAITKEDASQHT